MLKIDLSYNKSQEEIKEYLNKRSKKALVEITLVMITRFVAATKLLDINDDDINIKDWER